MEAFYGASEREKRRDFIYSQFQLFGEVCHVCRQRPAGLVHKQIPTIIFITKIYEVPQISMDDLLQGSANRRTTENLVP